MLLNNRSSLCVNLLLLCAIINNYTVCYASDKWRFAPSGNGFYQLEINRWTASGGNSWQPASSGALTDLLGNENKTDKMKQEAKQELSKFLNLSPSQLKAFATTLDSSKKDPANSRVSFGDFRRFQSGGNGLLLETKNGQLMMRDLKEGIQTGWSFLTPKKLKDMYDEKFSKLNPLVKNGDQLQWEAITAYFEKNGISKDHFGVYLRDQLANHPDEPFLLGSPQEVVRQVGDAKKMLGFLNAAKCTVAVVNGNGQSRNRRASKSAPSSTSGLVETYSFSRDELMQQSEAEMNAVRDQLKDGNGRSESSDEEELNVLRNKGKIFKAGRKAIQNIQGIGNEKVSILKLPQPATAADIDLRAKPPEFKGDREWMNYSDPHQAYGVDPAKTNVTFIDFANKKLGGDWRGHGNVQEEQMAQQSPDFAAILAKFNPLFNNSAKLQVRTGGDSFKAGENRADPILMTNLRFVLSQDEKRAKGNGLEKSNFKVIGGEFELKADAPPVNVLAIAAPRTGGPGKRYDSVVIKDMFDQAFSGFKAVKTNDLASNKQSMVVGGAWGAGVFGHSLDASIAIQAAAARLAGITQFRFAGVKDSVAKPVYDQVNLIVEDAIRAHPNDGGAIQAQVLQQIETMGGAWKTKR